MKIGVGDMAKAGRNKRTLLKFVAFAVVMFGFGYGLVPLYPVMCVALGINQTGVTDLPANTQIDKTRMVTVEFDTNLHHMAWKFRPLVNHVTVHPGELKQVMFEVVNDRDVPITGQAIPSYSPPLAGQHFHKLECFCFTKQTLAAGERREMPVVFVVDTSLPKEIATVTLSYTFFEVEGNQRSAAADGAGSVSRGGV